MSSAHPASPRQATTGLTPAALALLKEAEHHHSAGRTAAAIAPLDRFLRLMPRHFDALHLRGQLAHRQQDLDTAVRSYSSAISLQPLNPIPYYNLGLYLQEVGKLTEAQRLYEMALDLKPDLVPVLNNLGLVLRQRQQFAAAQAYFERAIALDPGYPFSYVNRAGLLVRQHRLQEALSDCNTAILLQRDYVDAWFNKGCVLSESLRHEEATTAYQYVLALAPEHTKAAFALAVTWLLLGDFAAGWRQYEIRWDNPELGLRRLAAEHSEWDGHTPLAGRRILVYFEQGLGDTLQFARFVPRLADLGARVSLLTQPALCPLLQGLDPRVEVLEQLPNTPLDLAVPLLSLPNRLGLGQESDLHAEPYLSADPDRQTHWQTWLGPRQRPRIGLAWSGNPKHRNDHERSLPLAELLRHLPEGLEYVVLQKEMLEEDVALLAQTPALRRPALGDFADSAALCSQLDLVISVDTSVAHLAGALGCPLWLMLPQNPDWRWLLAREDSPWYEQIRLWRQPRHGDWPAVMTAVGRALRHVFRLPG